MSGKTNTLKKSSLKSKDTTPIKESPGKSPVKSTVKSTSKLPVKSLPKKQIIVESESDTESDTESEKDDGEMSDNEVEIEEKEEEVFSRLRYLTQSEIDDIVSVLPKPIAAISTVSDEMHYQLKNKLSIELTEHKVDPRIIEDLKKEIYRQYHATLVQPGEAVGMGTGEAIGQQTTQMNLNTFHSTGSSKTLETNALRNLLNATPLKSPATLVHFKNKNLTYEQILKYEKEMVEITIDKLLLTYDIRSDTLHSKKEWWYTLYNLIYKKNISNQNCYVRLQFNLDLLYEYNVSLGEIVRVLEDYQNQEVSRPVLCIASPSNIGIVDVYLKDGYTIPKKAGKASLSISLENGDEEKEMFFSDILLPSLMIRKNNVGYIKGILGFRNLTPVSVNTYNIVKYEEFLSKGRYKLWLDIIEMKTEGIPLAKLETLFSTCQIQTLDKSLSQDKTNIFCNVQMPPDWKYKFYTVKKLIMKYVKEIEVLKEDKLDTYIYSVELDLLKVKYSDFEKILKLNSITILDKTESGSRSTLKIKLKKEWYNDLLTVIGFLNYHSIISEKDIKEDTPQIIEEKVGANYRISVHANWYNMSFYDKIILADVIVLNVTTNGQYTVLDIRMPDNWKNYFFTVKQFINILYQEKQQAKIAFIKKEKLLGVKLPIYTDPLYDAYEYTYAEVIGSNLSEILQHPDVDTQYTISNDIQEIIRTFDIEVARNVIAMFCNKIIKTNGSYINGRHIAFLADFMTNTGNVIPITAKGISKTSRDVFANASFEQPVDYFYKAAFIGKQEKSLFTSTSILMGKRIAIGTGALSLKLNEKALEYLDSFQSDEDLVKSKRDMQAYTSVDQQYAKIKEDDDISEKKKSLIPNITSYFRLPDVIKKILIFGTASATGKDTKDFETIESLPAKVYISSNIPTSKKTIPKIFDDDEENLDEILMEGEL